MFNLDKNIKINNNMFCYMVHPKDLKCMQKNWQTVIVIFSVNSDRKPKNWQKSLKIAKK